MCIYAAYSEKEPLPKTKPVVVSMKTCEGKGEETLLHLIREIEMAMTSAMLQTGQQIVAMAILKLVGRVREWVLTCNTSVSTLR